MKRKKETRTSSTAICQLRTGNVHPFSTLRGYVPLGGGEERIYRQIREAVPVLDAAVGKLVRLSGGFEVRCPEEGTSRKLQHFLRTLNCGRGQWGIDSFLSAYLDSLLTPEERDEMLRLLLKLRNRLEETSPDRAAEACLPQK